MASNQVHAQNSETVVSPVRETRRTRTGAPPLPPPPHVGAVKPPLPLHEGAIKSVLVMTTSSTSSASSSVSAAPSVRAVPTPTLPTAVVSPTHTHAPAAAAAPATRSDSRASDLVFLFSGIQKPVSTAFIIYIYKYTTE